MTSLTANRPLGSRQSPPADLGALGFLLACGALVLPLILTGLLPRWILAVDLAAVAGLGLLFVARALLIRELLPGRAGGTGWTRNLVDGANLLILLLVPLGIWASADKALAWPVACRVIAGFAVFYAIAGLAGTRWQRLLPWGFLLLGVALALILVLDTRWRSAAKLPWFPQEVYGFLPSYRLLPLHDSPMGPNAAGGALALLLPLAVALALWGQGRGLRLAALAASLPIGFVLFLTQSRGAWIGAAGALLVMPGLRYRKWWLVLALLLAAAMLALLLTGGQAAQVAWSTLLDRKEPDVSQMTFNGRVPLWINTLQLIREYPLTGVGFGAYEPAMRARAAELKYELPGGPFQHAHNLALQTAVEFGMLGTIAFLALLAGLASSLLLAIRGRPDGPWAAPAIGLFGTLLVFAVHGIVEAQIVSPYTYVIAFALFGAAAVTSQAALPAVRAGKALPLGPPAAVGLPDHAI